MSVWTAEALRDAALRRLGPFGDARARDALVHGTLTIAAGVSRWTASAGAVEGHRVTIALDAARLGRLRDAPAVEDALTSATAAAVATRAGQALFDFALRWGRTAPPVATPYRGASTSGTHDQALRDALVDYLGGSEAAVARRLVHAEVESSGGEVRVVVPAAGGPALSADSRALALIARALRDLTGDAHARVAVITP